MVVRVKKTKTIETIGEWSFILGVLLAIVIGLAQSQGVMLEAATVASVFVILGALVGLINISSRSAQGFLVAAIALLVAKGAGLGTLALVGAYIGPILQNIATFVAPAAVIVALKAVYELGK